MNGMWIVIGLGGAASVASVLALRWRVRQRVRERWNEGAAGGAEFAEDEEAAEPAIRRYRWVPPVAAAAVAGLLWWSPLSGAYAFSFALIVGLLSAQAEQIIYNRRMSRLEVSLADAIDLMVAALGAGAGTTAALQAAQREAPRLLAEILEETVGRIQFGDDPGAVFRDLSDRVPVETFLLFASTMGVHWEVGGSLAPILATVGRTIRDRIETTRRIRSNSVQTQVSVFAVLGLTYFLAALMWRTNPDHMEAFLRSEIATWFVAGSMILQAFGIAWMSHISRMKF
jgi:tight adherence protein B